MRGSIATALGAALSMMLACTQKTEHDDPFGVPGGGPGPVTAGPSGDDDEDEDDESEGSSGESSTGGDEGVGTAGAGPAGEDTSAMASTGGWGEPMDTGAATDGGGPPMMTGMYGECLVPQDCLAPTNVCIVVNDTEGFCTNMACTNPATDCEPSPGGTATPICFPIELNGMPTASCALGCAGGLTCPAGMTCWPLAEGSICA